MAQPKQTIGIDRGPRTDRELWHFVRALWGVTIPNTQVCPHHVPPFRVFADAYFARYPVIVLKGSRGLAGKSWTLATLANTMAVGLASQVTILGGSGAQSLNVQNAAKALWEYESAPTGMLTGTPTKYDQHFANGAWIRSLMASQTSVRGPHPQRLLLDEIDEMDLDVLEGAQGQPMKGKHGKQKGIETCTVMSSTHQYAMGTMTTILERARERGWPIYEVCYRENMNPVDGWLTQDEVDRKRSEIAKVMWESEYELGEPSIEGRVLDTESVERCFDRDLGQGEVTNWTDPMIETLLADSKIAKSLLFVTGVDWAKEQDRTIISTFMVDKVSGRWTCVAWSAMSRMPWPVMVAAAEERLRKFPGGFAHDSTGLGNVIADYFDPSLRRRFNRVFADRIMGSGRSRQDLFSNYISAIENDLIRYPRLTIPYNEHRFCTWDDLFGSGHAPDSFVAGAIAWSLRKDMMGHRVPTPMGILRKSA